MAAGAVIDLLKAAAEARRKPCRTASSGSSRSSPCTRTAAARPRNRWPIRRCGTRCTACWPTGTSRTRTQPSTASCCSRCRGLPRPRRRPGRARRAAVRGTARAPDRAGTGREQPGLWRALDTLVAADQTADVIQLLGQMPDCDVARSLWARMRTPVFVQRLLDEARMTRASTAWSSVADACAGAVARPAARVRGSPRAADDVRPSSPCRAGRDAPDSRATERSALVRHQEPAEPRGVSRPAAARLRIRRSGSRTLTRESGARPCASRCA